MPKDPFLENAVMDVLWDADAWCTPGEVRAALAGDHSVGYTTVMTVMARLWKKGRLARRRAGRAYAYAPEHTRSEYAALRMEEILETAGDRSLTLGRFLDTVTDQERSELRDVLEQGS